MRESGGEVITHVVEAIKKGRRRKHLLMPRHCPECGSTVHKSEDEVAYRCVNAACPAKLKESLQHYAGRHAMNIDGLGEKIVDQLVEQKLVKDVAVFFWLKGEKVREPQRYTAKISPDLVPYIHANT